MDLAVCCTLFKRNGFILRIGLLVSLWITSACYCTQVCAQKILAVKDTAQTDSARIRHLQQVNIQAAKFNLRNTSPTPVQILKGDQLQRLNSFSVADALRFFSGVQLKDYGGIGGLKTINVRSLGTNHTNVFYDGVQLGNVQNGQVDLGRFSLDNIDEVSLYSGQKSEIFMPAKGFSSASSIYLQSARPGFENGERTHLRLNYKTGSFGLIDPSVLWQQKLSENISSTVSAEWVKADGRYKFRYTNGVYDTTAVRNNTDIASYRLEAGLNGRLADSSQWAVKAYGYTSDRGLPGAIVANKFNYTQRQWDRNEFIQANYKTDPRKRYTLMAIAKYADNYLRYLDPEFVTTTGFLDNRFYEHEIYLSVANRYKILPVWEVALLTDYQWNTLNANLYRFPYPVRNTELVALASQLKLQRFTLQASLLGTFVEDKTRVFTSAGNKQEYTPTVMASWQVFKSSDFLLRAFYKDIFRLPTFNDLYYTFIGNTLLKPEYTKQYDIGFTYGHVFQNQALTSISLQVDGYYNSIKDKIVAIPSQNLYRWTMYNLGKVEIHGLDVGLQSNWQVWDGLNINAALNYTYQPTKDVTDPDNPLNVPYAPRHGGSFTAQADYRSFEFNYSYIYTGEHVDQAGGQTAYAPPWYTHDVSFGYRTKIYQRKTKLTLEVNNLFNQDREIITNFPMPRRFYRLKISYTI